MRIGALSAKYESNGNSTAVSQDSNDAGGWSYGIYQFASVVGKVQDFVNWLCQRSAPCDGYGRQLTAAGDPTCEQAFADKWQEIGNANPEGFAQVQDDYVRPQYYDSSAEILLNKYGFDISGHKDASKAIQIATHSEWAHVGIEMLGGIVEALANGVKLSEIDIYYRIY